MDPSPVIFDSATKFGRDIDMDRDFPGFPFDEEVPTGFGRRGSDIRSHLDELAARHPEFADQLLGPPWADVPFPSFGTAGRQRAQQPRNSDRFQHNHPDEDARSQASGGSAASGASGVSSHSEPDPPTHSHHHQTTSMEMPQQQRNIRSTSAPPENRPGTNGQQQQQQQPQNDGRFVSRVDIGSEGQPQQQQQPAGQPQSQSAQREKSPAPGQKANVRQIPIFVEGRDKPVIAKDVDRDETDSPRRQQSPQPSQFHRPSSHFQQRYNRHPTDWGFQDPFFEQQSGCRRPASSQHQAPFSTFKHGQPQENPWHSQSHHTEPQHPSQRQKPQPQTQQKPQQPQSEPQPEAPPKPKPQVQPKDPLEKVAMVQKEVDALTEQVKQYTGNSRQDKQYMYLDEMLTRELIKLDDIDTEGKENVRQARKQAIKSIQESISLLESKAPLPGQQQPANEGEQEQTQNQTQQQEQPQEQQTEEKKTDTPAEAVKEEEKPVESMDTAEPAGTPLQPTPPQEEPKPAIPLPPPTSAETSQTAAATEITEGDQNIQGAEQIIQTPDTIESSNNSIVSQEQPASDAETKKTSGEVAIEQEFKIEPNSTQLEVVQVEPMQTDEPASVVTPMLEEKQQQIVAVSEKPKKQAPPVPTKPKKKARAPKRPQPVSETPIPLPGPEH
ncbi:hypothetical protein QAD02_006474 [Eretmocerus hayati]|uniref:Uncharacterized protein n=1 Tax=Eretmocerus hayati TaxID=131215 RepID=A0ACC2N3A9_9HYME|nr:hypothetical protein QAD02_006474 [Eretmocerus hayati]